MKVQESALLRKYTSVAYQVNFMFINVTSNFENDMFYFCRGWSAMYSAVPLSCAVINFIQNHHNRRPIAGLWYLIAGKS